MESLDIFIDIPEKFERTFPRKIYKFRTVGHFIYLRPYPAAGHLITAYFKSKVLKYHIAFSKCFEYHDRPAGLNYFANNREISDDFSALVFGRLNSLKREITRESTLKNIEESSITQSYNSKIRKQTGSAD